jgi:hypothetical protein
MMGFVTDTPASMPATAAALFCVWNRKHPIRLSVFEQQP